MENQDEYEITPPSFLKIASKYGVFLGLGLIVIALLLKVGNFGNAFNFIWYISLFMLGGMFICLHHARKSEFDMYFTYGKAFRFGMILTVFVAFSLSIYVFAITTFVDKEWITNSAVETEEKISDSLDKIPEQYREMMEESIEQMYATKPLELTWGMLINVAFLGLILSAILAIFFRTKKPDSFESDLA